jgi:hypothetical protein
MGDVLHEVLQQTRPGNYLYKIPFTMQGSNHEIKVMRNESFGKMIERIALSYDLDDNFKDRMRLFHAEFTAVIHLHRCVSHELFPITVKFEAMTVFFQNHPVLSFQEFVIFSDEEQMQVVEIKQMLLDKNAFGLRQHDWTIKGLVLSFFSRNCERF